MDQVIDPQVEQNPSGYISIYPDGPLINLPDYQMILITGTTVTTQTPDIPLREKSVLKRLVGRFRTK